MQSEVNFQKESCGKYIYIYQAVDVYVDVRVTITQSERSGRETHTNTRSHDHVSRTNRARGILEPRDKATSQ